MIRPRGVFLCSCVPQALIWLLCFVLLNCGQMQKDSSILLLVSYTTTLPQCSEFSIVKLKVWGLMLLFFFSLCGYLQKMYSVLCSVSSFQRHYITWRIFVFESAQDIFAIMWSYLAALSNFSGTAN